MLVRNGINNNDDNDNDRITNGRIQKSDNGFWPQSLANEGLCASWVPVLKVMPPISNQPASHCLSINAHNLLRMMITKVIIMIIIVSIMKMIITKKLIITILYSIQPASPRPCQ